MTYSIIAGLFTDTCRVFQKNVHRDGMHEVLWYEACSIKEKLTEIGRKKIYALLIDVRFNVLRDRS